MFLNTAPRTKLLQVIIPLAIMSIALSGCAGATNGTDATNSPDETNSPDTPTSSRIAAVIKGLDNPFFQAMQAGIEDTAQIRSVEVTVQAATGNGDSAGQADRLTALAGQDFGCFIVNPISGSNLTQALSQVSAADKAIVNIDSPIDADSAKTANVNIATYIGTDNKAAGGKAGAFISEQVPAGSEVAVIGGIAGDVTSGARVDGFLAEIEGNLTVIQVTAANWERELALTAATDIMAANPNIKAFFAANDTMGLGIVKAVENAGKTGQIVVVSVDGNPDALESVRAGGLSATVAQYPYAIGTLGLQACEVLLAGESIPANIESPTALVSKDVADMAIAAFPQPFEAFENPLTSLLGSK